MRCHECHEQEATFHEVVLHKGQRVERHLCEQCARDAGISNDPHMPISQLISSYMMGQNLPIPKVGRHDKKDSKKTSRPSPACVGCGLTFTRFMKSGLLGCSACYCTFVDRLGPMIERAHEGGCVHMGKVPRRALCESQNTPDTTRLNRLLGDARQREERLENIRAQLAKCVQGEDYEQAARLRDELTRISLLASSQVEPSPIPEHAVKPEESSSSAAAS
ncbi:MAG: UvrB/UvrC motif-containing protein [Phycisphaerales bacterium]|nr:UvrB/UvrC motif-containing protein [Phycisphaerales bacterium]